MTKRTVHVTSQGIALLVIGSMAGFSPPAAQAGGGECTPFTWLSTCGSGMDCQACPTCCPVGEDCGSCSACCPFPPFACSCHCEGDWDDIARWSYPGGPPPCDQHVADYPHDPIDIVLIERSNNTGVAESELYLRINLTTQIVDDLTIRTLDDPGVSTDQFVMEFQSLGKTGNTLTVGGTLLLDPTNGNLTMTLRDKAKLKANTLTVGAASSAGTTTVVVESGTSLKTIDR